MTINHINAGIIITQARMAGLDLIGAITLAKLTSLTYNRSARAYEVYQIAPGGNRQAVQFFFDRKDALALVDKLKAEG